MGVTIHEDVETTSVFNTLSDHFLPGAVILLNASLRSLRKHACLSSFLPNPFLHVPESGANSSTLSLCRFDSAILIQHR